MDEALAREMSVELASMVAALNRLGELTMSIADEDERRAYRHTIGQLIVRCDFELIQPIAKIYPHLDPVKG